MPDNDHLLQSLGLNDKDQSQEDALAGLEGEEGGEGGAAPSSTVLELDDWDLRRGADILTEATRLHNLDLDDKAVADFHGAAFLPTPSLVEECEDEYRQEFLGKLLESAEYKAIHESTRMDVVSSEIAAVVLSERFAQSRPKRKEGEPPPTPPEPGSKEALKQELKLAGEVRKALEEASEKVQEEKEAREACGLGPGSPGSNDPHRIAALFRRVRSSQTLRRICELAGRFRRLAQSKQRQKVSHGYDDMVGVKLDGDVAQLLPSELAQLGDEDLELLALKRIAERQALSREYQGVEKVGKGPIVVVCDECLHPDTLLPTADGRLVRIADVKAGDMMLSVDFRSMRVIPQRVGRVAVTTSPAKLFKVVTTDGSVRCSGTHRFFVLSENGEVVERRAEELRVGDKVAAPRRFPVTPPAGGHELTFGSWAEMLGSLLGDGGAYLHRNTKKVCLFDDNEEHLELHAKFWERHGYKPLIRNWRGKRVLTVNNADLARFLQSEPYRSLVTKQPERFIPDFVMRWNNQALGRFLRGFFDAEGSVGNHQVTLTVSSLKLVEQTRGLLRRFGILTELDWQYSEHGDKWYPRVVISRRESLDTFRSEIGFSRRDKRRALTDISCRPRIDSKSRYNHVPVSRQALSEEAQRAGMYQFRCGLTVNCTTAWLREMADRAAAYAEDVAENGVMAASLNLSGAGRRIDLTKKRVQNARKKPNSPLRHLANERLRETIPEVLALEGKMRALADGDIYWTDVRSIEQFDTDTHQLYDLTMDGEHANYLTTDYVVHNSGSMQGEKCHTAKALALALAWVARLQSRWCGLVAFAGNTGDRVLALPPQGWDEAALCAWLEAFIGGGSDLDLPLKELPGHFRRMKCPEGKTDVIFVTDALIHVTPRVKDDFLRWKLEAQVRAIALVIQSRVGPLRELVDEAYEVRGLDVGEEGVGRSLSI